MTSAGMSATPTLPDDIVLIVACAVVRNCPRAALRLQRGSFLRQNEGQVTKDADREVFTVNTEENTVTGAESRSLMSEYIGHQVTVVPYQGGRPKALVVIWRDKARSLSMREAEELNALLL